MNKKTFLIIFIVAAVLISLFNSYYGSIDVGDYADTAKFFSGNHQAKLRASHSIVYGLMLSPFVRLGGFVIFKVISLLCLSLLVLSVYFISNRNKKTLLLILLAPVIYYILPWASSIQLATLLFVWAYYFLKKYKSEETLKYLMYSGMLIGLAWAVWDSVIYFALVLSILFLYDKKLSHYLIFLLFIFIGVIPKLVVDQLLFGFAFFSIVKHFSACIFALLTGNNVYGKIFISTSFWSRIRILLVLPIYSLLFFKKKVFLKHWRLIVFLGISFIFFFLNAQIRYLVFFFPFFILILGKVLTRRQLKIQLSIFIILIIIISVFNAMQPSNQNSLIKEDLIEISKEYGGESFVVGNSADDFQIIAHNYWDDKLYFVSIQDYKLYLNDTETIFEKELCSNTKIWNRRDICFSAKLNKNKLDNTDYEGINFGIGYNEPLELKGFKFIKKYNILYLYEK